MAFTLDKVVPWGRSFEEYVRMFALSELEMKTRRILGCGDGPAAFNAVAARHGFRVTSCDPLYAFTQGEIRRRIDKTFPVVLEQTRANASTFVWGQGIDSPEALGELRLRAMETFLEDYEAGLRAGRYVSASLPALPFEANAFDLALCSHFLFLYSDHLSAEFHLDSILEMLRLAPEARIFPLLGLDGHPSPHLDFVQTALRERGFNVTIAPVPYEFQKGGKWMLRASRPRPIPQD